MGPYQACLARFCAVKMVIKSLASLQATRANSLELPKSLHLKRPHRRILCHEAVNGLPGTLSRCQNVLTSAASVQADTASSFELPKSPQLKRLQSAYSAMEP
jgi:hypothetical protein